MQELERELGVRKRCYPGWIDNGKVGKYEAAERMSRLEAVAQLLDNAVCIICADTSGELQKKLVADLQKVVTMAPDGAAPAPF